MSSSGSTSLVAVILMKTFLKATPKLMSDFHSDEFKECDGRDFLDSESDLIDGVMYPKPL